MLHEDPFVSTGVTLLAALVYGYIGYRLWHRDVSPGVRLAARSFAIWWVALATNTLLGVFAGLIAHFGVLDLRIHLMLTYVGLGVLCVALWALLYYLVFLFTGRSAAIVPITAFYIVYFLALVYYVTFSRPIDVDVEGLEASIAYAAPIRGVFFGIVLSLLVLPQIVGALAYGSLFLRVRHRTQRYRIVIVSSAIIIWFGTVLLGVAVGADARWVYWDFFSRAVGLAASLMLLGAYFPPRWVRKTFGIETIKTVEDRQRSL